MRLVRLLAVPCLLAATLAGPADAGVTVAFDHPERFTDAGLHGGYGARSRAPALDGLARHIEKLGARWLRPGQSLAITVLDIDLAGRFEPWRPTASEVRFLRDITWPRITLRHVLSEGGRTVAAAEEAVVDLNYQMRPGVGRSGDSLAYEKAMLDDWFRARFVEGRPAPR
ncbi:MAG: DUF3016 domain-containing protein [Alphaproteobacteria bacterium]|nr:DUF3016 domain-containing protein [Alphaproteobacteria bacterium]